MFELRLKKKKKNIVLKKIIADNERESQGTLVYRTIPVSESGVCPSSCWVVGQPLNYCGSMCEIIGWLWSESADSTLCFGAACQHLESTKCRLHYYYGNLVKETLSPPAVANVWERLVIPHPIIGAGYKTSPLGSVTRY